MPTPEHRIETAGIGAVAFLSALFGFNATAAPSDIPAEIPAKAELQTVAELPSAVEIPAIAEASADSIADVKPERESLFPNASRSLAFSHFTWGAEIGGSIDLTGHDMSTFDIDAVFGYKNKWIRVVGVGVGVHRSFGTSNMFIPVYVVFRSSFRPKPSLFFLSAKAGYSFNTISDSATYGDISSSLGWGINLAMSKRFRSHIILGVSYRHFRERHRANFNLDTQNIVLANVSFGVDF